MKRPKGYVQIPELDGYVIAYLEESIGSRYICIYGDPKGLRSLGEAIIAIADVDQKSLPNQQCPPEDSFHKHYATGLEADPNIRPYLPRLTIGRVDEKASGRFRDVFPARIRRRKSR